MGSLFFILTDQKKIRFQNFQNFCQKLMISISKSVVIIWKLYNFYNFRNSKVFASLMCNLFIYFFQLVCFNILYYFMFRFTQDYQRDDVLLTGFQNDKMNPYRPKSSFQCMLLWEFYRYKKKWSSLWSRYPFYKF